jgi:hypothetical protein
MQHYFNFWEFSTVTNIAMPFYHKARSGFAGPTTCCENRTRSCAFVDNKSENRIFRHRVVLGEERGIPKICVECVPAEPVVTEGRGALTSEQGHAPLDRLR